MGRALSQEEAIALGLEPPPAKEPGRALGHDEAVALGLEGEGQPAAAVLANAPVAFNRAPEQRGSSSYADAEFENAADLTEASRLGRDALATGYVNGTDFMTYGLANKMRDADAASPFPAAERKAMDERNPVPAAVGKGAGALASAFAGPARVIDTGVRAGIGALLPSAARSAVGRVATSAAAGAATAGAQGAVMEGDGEGGAMTGALFGGGAQAIGESAKGISALLGKSNWIGRFQKAKDSGLLAQAEREAAAGQLSKDPEGQFAVAAKARDRIMARDAELAGQESGALHAARAPHLDQPADLMAIETKLEEIANKNRLSSGKPINGSLDGQITAIREKLSIEPTNDDILRLRESMREAAAFGEARPTNHQLQARKLYRALREGVQDSPIGAADKVYANAQRVRERRNDLLLGREDGPREVQLAERAPDAPPATLRETARAGDEQVMAERLSRLGDTNVPGARAAPRLAEVRAQGDPEINAALDELEARKAWMATRFGAPDMPTHLSDATGLGGYLNFIRQNATALGARGVDPMARAVQATGHAGVQMTPAISPFLLRLSQSLRGRPPESSDR